jgi:hypothetical protein
MAPGRFPATFSNPHALQALLTTICLDNKGFKVQRKKYR